jgi:hypothetical protein
VAQVHRSLRHQLSHVGTSHHAHVVAGSCLTLAFRTDLFKLEDDATKAKFSSVVFEIGCCEMLDVIFIFAVFIRYVFPDLYM